MKRRKTIISIICIFVFVLSMAGCSKISLVTDQGNSFYSGYKVVDGKVNIFCVLILKNNTGDRLSFRIKGDFSEDKKDGLVTESELFAVSESNSDQFILEKNEKKNCNVIFIGVFNGTDQKQDKSLPKKINFEILNK